MIIDAHQHFWQLSLPFDYQWLKTPEHAPINRDFLPCHLEQEMQSVGVAKTVLVQTQHRDEENWWFLNLASEHDFILGVVGWVDLESENCEEQLLRLKQHPKFVGIRHLTHNEPDDNFIVRPSVIRGLKILEKHNVPLDLLFFTQHLRHATTLAEQLPNLMMVIDHLAKPKIKDRITAGWVDDMRAASRFPNLFCKLSGMVTEADWEHWKPKDLLPYIETALECFGAERCMFGSDWPVCELASCYRNVFSALESNVEQLSPSEKEALYAKTAMRFYQRQEL